MSTQVALQHAEREIAVAEKQFELSQRRAKLFASSDIVPKEYQGNLANCVIAMEMAQRLGVGELQIMQNLHMIHGRPSFSSAYLIARINSLPILKGRLRFEYVGTPGKDDHGCFAVGIDAETEEKIVGTTVTVKMAKDQGWWGKNGSKWPHMTEQMLSYRAAAFWCRVNAPEAMMGMTQTAEELADIKDVAGSAEFEDLRPASSDLNAAFKAKEAVDKRTGEIIDQEPEPVAEPEPEAEPVAQAEPEPEAPVAPKQEPLTEDQAEKIRGAVRSSGIAPKDFLNHFGIESTAELDASSFDGAMEWINNNAKEPELAL